MQLIFDGGVTLIVPRGLNLNYFDDTNRDGVYNMTSFRSGGWDDKGFNEEQVTFSRGLRFYGANGEALQATNFQAGIPVPYTVAKSAVLESHSGHRFLFEVVNPPYGFDSSNPDDAMMEYWQYNGGRIGRLIGMQDHNGRGISMTYKSFTDEELLQSPSRIWQMDKIRDACGREAVVSYHPEQQMSRWVIDSVALPGGALLQYEYNSGRLSRVVYPDGSESTIGCVYNQDTGLIVVDYKDANAAVDGENETVFMNGAAWSTPNESYYNVASSVVRMVINGAGEIAYLNTAADQYRQRVYEGGGLLKRIDPRGGVDYIAGWDIDSLGYSGQVADSAYTMQTPEPTVIRYVNGTNGSKGSGLFDEWRKKSCHVGIAILAWARTGSDPAGQVFLKYGSRAPSDCGGRLFSGDWMSCSRQPERI